MRKTVSLVIIIVIVVIGITWGGVWLWNYKTNFPVPNSRSASDFTATIKQTMQPLINQKGEPIFDIINTKKIATHWYIVTIQQKNTPKTAMKSKLLINDPYFDSSYMNVVAGPETTFSKNELIQKGLSEEVIQEAIK